MCSRRRMQLWPDGIDVPTIDWASPYSSLSCVHCALMRCGRSRWSRSWPNSSEFEPAVFDLYARRDETRREHIGEITALLGLRAMRKADYRPSIMAAAQTAVATERAEPIVRAIVEDLKLRRVIVPKLKNLIGVIARLQVLRQIGLADDRRKSIHANRYNVIAREARVMPARDLLRFTPERRCAVLVAFAVERQAALTDLAR